MKNFSLAYGTISLKGNWSQEIIDIFTLVLDIWNLDGKCGIQNYDGLSLENPSTSFCGLGSWTFSGLLSEFSDWTWDWVGRHEGNGYGLSAEKYQRLLHLMADRDLSILIDFKDYHELTDIDFHETGRLTSDGSNLCYETLCCNGNVADRKDYFDRCFNNTVEYFQSLAPDADRKQIRRWVRIHIAPTNLFFAGTAFKCDATVASLYFTESDLLNFSKTFSPHGKAWHEAVMLCDTNFHWNIAA